MFSFEINNNEFQINTRLVGGSDIDPTMIDVSKLGEILQLAPGTFDRIIDPSGAAVDIDTYHNNRINRMREVYEELGPNLLPPGVSTRGDANTCIENANEYDYFNNDICQKAVDELLRILGGATTKQWAIDAEPSDDYITFNSLEWAVRQYGPKALVNILVSLGVKGETASNGHTAPVSYETWEASIRAGDAGNRAGDWNRWTLGHRVPEVVDDPDNPDVEAAPERDYGLLDERTDGLRRVIMYLTHNYQWINPGKMGLEPTVADAQTGVNYNKLKQNVDIEAMQYAIAQKHATFRVSVQGLFGVHGINPQFSFGLSAVQGGGYRVSNQYTVTEEQFKGGALPVMMPLSLMSKVPSFSEDIERQIRKNIAMLKAEGKNLTAQSQQQIDSAISGMKQREQQLSKMVESFERMLRDKSFSPSGPGSTITMDDVLNYADKVKTGQTKLADILKVLANIVPASSTSTLSTTP